MEEPRRDVQIPRRNGQHVHRHGAQGETIGRKLRPDEGHHLLPQIPQSPEVFRSGEKTGSRLLSRPIPTGRGYPLPFFIARCTYRKLMSDVASRTSPRTNYVEGYQDSLINEENVKGEPRIFYLWVELRILQLP